MNADSKGHILRRVRIISGLFFFFIICFIFLDFHAVLPDIIYENGFYLQFIPSLLAFFNDYNITASGFIIVLLITIFFGRFYCSSFCPLGIFMDFTGRMGRTKRSYRKPNKFIRYFLLLTAIASLLTGSLILLNLLEPFSIFGRLATSFFKPALVTLNNLTSYIFEYFGSFALPPYRLKNIHIVTMIVSLIYGLIIVTLSMTKGRLYCNMICPVGTFLGIVSKFSFFKIRINNTCVDCGNCENICKSECIDIKNKNIDHERCVACFNCITACPVNAVDYRTKNKNKEEKPPTHTRREFIAVLASLLAFSPKISRGEKKIVVTVPNKIPLPKRDYPIVPPGAKSLDHLLLNCSGCHACISKCPTQVLQPSITEYGLDGLFMPYLDPKTAFCTPNCTECGKICPTNAIYEFTLEEKKAMQLGEVHFIRENCIPILQKTDCGACSEHCPTKAVYMAKEGKVRVPKIDPKICIGCGACENVCPAKPNKSIYVKPHRIHKKAEKPVVKKQDQIVPEKGIEEFPF